MNAAAQTLLFAVTSVAAAAALGVAIADHTTAAPATEIVKLERVVVVGKRVDLQAPVVAKLPRVVIEQHRVASADDVRLAQALPATPVI